MLKVTPQKSLVYAAKISSRAPEWAHDQFRLETGKTGDSDYHLVVSDDSLQFSPGGSGTQPVAHSFVAEAVDPNCVAGRHGNSPVPSQFATPSMRNCL